MGLLVEEVRIWNTPLISAYLLWQFSNGYSDNHPTGDAPIGLLHFITNAILTSRTLSERITNQRADLQSYIRSFEEKREADLLLSIHERVKEKFKHTLFSIDIAIAHGLLVWDADSGKLYPKKLSRKPSKGRNLKAIIEKDGKKAEILGRWFAQHDLHTITSYLKVVL